MTRSLYQVPYFELQETHVATFQGARRPKCHDWPLKKPKNKKVVGVSKRFSRSISHAVYCLYTFFFSFWLIRSLVDATLAALIVCGPLQFNLVTQNYRRLYG